MKKTTKGALSAAAAGTLLLGGAGSYAFWSASAHINAGSASSGSFSLEAGSCDSAWKYAPDKADAGKTVTLIAPGDVITKNCTFTIGATGDHLTAKVTAPSSVSIAAPDGTTTFDASAATTYAVGGTNARAIANGDNIDSGDDGATLTATFVVTFPYGDASAINSNDTQNVTASLDDLTVSVTQNNPNA